MEGLMQIVFVVDGGTGVAQLAQQLLERAGFVVHMLSTESNVIQRAQRNHPVLIMIDTRISGNRGLDLCRRIREASSLSRTPVILLAAESSEEESISGLEAGADDYISEFSGREFVARIQAVIRRFARMVPCAGIPQPSAALNHFLGGSAPAIKAGDIEIDTSSMRISVRGSEIETTTLEFRLMYYLSHHRACVLSRDQLLDAVWGTQYVGPRTVDACVRRLRHKIEPDRSSPTYLKTIRGAGYCLNTVAGEA
jgi:DNA-binding response OmpR family regulator